MPRVTVYIPAYNHERFVGEAIRSVLAQTFTDFELIVVDDASTDGTLAEIRRFNDPRLKHFALPHNRGATAVTNFCLSMAQGDYVTPLGSDDFIHPDKLSRQVAFLNEHPELMAVTAQPAFVDEDGQSFKEGHSFAHQFTRENRSREQWLKHFFLHCNCLCHPTAMIRRTTYQRIGTYHEMLRQLPDFDFWVRLCLAGSLHVMADELTFFRVRNNDGNVSAPSLRNCAVAQHEYAWILRHYLCPTVLDNITSIFGEEWGSAPSPHLALAEIAWQAGSAPHRMFAVQTLLDAPLQQLDETCREEVVRRARELLLQADVFREQEVVQWQEDKLRWREKHRLDLEKLEAARAKHAAAKQELEQIKHSLGWQLTKPLRMLQSCFHRSKS